jgi:hypothetical protein
MADSITADSLRADAARFFDWSRFNLDHYVQKLDPIDRKEFASGKAPERVFRAVCAAWSTNLKSHLPWDAHFAAIRKALPNPHDYSAFMNCPMGQEHKLPKRIRTAVARERQRSLKRIHAAFFANAGEARVKTYLRIWQSQSEALNKLIIQAWGYRCRKGGGASIGETEVDIERMMLSEAESTGSAMKVTGLLRFIRSLWESEKTVLVRTATSRWRPTPADWAAGLERRVIPNPDKSETRLNRFLIKLGRALTATEKRRELPDWMHMNQTIRFVVHGWCESIIVDGERWPQLCFLTTPALAKFLTLCTPQRWTNDRDPRSLERAITRLGLIRFPGRRIKHVEKKAGQIFLT